MYSYRLLRMVMVFSLLLVPGCKLLKGGGGGPRITAPSYLKSHVQGHLNSLADCWRANGVPNAKNNKSSLNVIPIPATGDYKGIPTFVYSGQQVGGVHWGRCGRSGTMHIAVRGTYFDQAVLRHECCHHLDKQGPCFEESHNMILKKGGCCPHWPYLGSRAMTASATTSLSDSIVEVHTGFDKGLIVTTVLRKFDDGTDTCVLLFNPPGVAIMDVRGLTVRAEALAAQVSDAAWWQNLKDYLSDHGE